MNRALVLAMSILATLAVASPAVAEDPDDERGRRGDDPCAQYRPASRDDDRSRKSIRRAWVRYRVCRERVRWCQRQDDVPKRYWDRDDFVRWFRWCDRDRDGRPWWRDRNEHGPYVPAHVGRGHDRGDGDGRPRGDHDWWERDRGRWCRERDDERGRFSSWGERDRERYRWCRDRDWDRDHRDWCRDRERERERNSTYGERDRWCRDREHPRSCDQDGRGARVRQDDCPPRKPPCENDGRSLREQDCPRPPRKDDKRPAGDSEKKDPGGERPSSDRTPAPKPKPKAPEDKPADTTATTGTTTTTDGTTPSTSTTTTDATTPPAGTGTTTPPTDAPVEPANPVEPATSGTTAPV